MSEQYEKTLSPAWATPPGRQERISIEHRHYRVGRYRTWNGRCYSSIKVALATAPDTFVLYLPSAVDVEIDVSENSTVSPTLGLFGEISHLEKVLPREDRSHIGMAFEKSA
ncbi:AraC family transcriptional regulator, partial [Rhizobium leguminosarum]